MECMCAQTRPQYNTLIQTSFGGFCCFFVCFENGVRTHFNSKGKIPSFGCSGEDRTHDATSRRTVGPTHYRLSYSGPVSQRRICSDSCPRAATLREKLQIKLYIPPSDSILTPGQPVLTQILQTLGGCQGSRCSTNFVNLIWPHLSQTTQLCCLYCPEETTAKL